MKSLLTLPLLGALIAVAGAFCGVWTLPHLEDFPTYHTVGEKRDREMESRAQRSLDASFDGPFAHTPNKDSARREAELRKAGKQMAPR